MSLIQRQPALHHIRMKGRLLGGLLALTLMPVMMVADTPIASSSFVGAEDPLSENGAWVALTSLSANGNRFQKNNGAYPNQLGDTVILHNHAGARTTAVVPADHYSEIVVGHVASWNNVGPIVRVQSSGLSVDSHYLWWAAPASGGQNAVYRVDADGVTYTSSVIIPTSPVVDGDRLRFIARGPVIYGIKNGVRDFIYNTGPNSTKYATGTTGILAFATTALTDAMIASWSTGPAPVSSGTWASSTFVGTENPLDEGDRWYPLPGYLGFRKAGGQVIGLGSSYTASGVWSIAPPATQYSEVTLGAVSGGGGGPIVRIDRNNPGPTGWLLFLYATSPSSSGIYKMTPDGGFTAVRLFTPIIVSGDKWRLTANGNTLEVFRNGVSQFTYATDGSYPTGDVGIEAFTPAFTFTGWEGGDIAGDTTPPTAPSNLTATAASTSQINLAWTASTDNVRVTEYLVERCQGASCPNFGQIASVTGTAYNDTGLAANTSYSYQVRARDAAGNNSPYSNVARATTLAPPAPTITSFTPTSGAVWDSVTISGTNFSGATAVTFNGSIASYTVTFDTEIHTTVPIGATTGPLSVTTPGGTATSASNFTVVIPPPTITDFTPTSGPEGASVTINGKYFMGATAVTFNGVNAAFNVISPTAIQATVPTGATTGPLTVTTPKGTATSASNFTVAPRITSFTPTSGPVGTNVTISGANFSGATAVTFNGSATSFIVTSATAIQATVPTGASTGPLSVTTPAGTATSVSNFTVIPPPTITGFTPASGPVGTSVTISGMNLAGATAVKFNGVNASFTVSSATAIQATVPAGAASGPLSVTTPGGTATSASSFAVTVTLSVSKTSGPLGTGSGTVSSNIGGINCGPNCSASYNLNTVVILTATPDMTSVFNGWTGCDSVSGMTCTVTTSTARTVTVQFLP